MARYARKRFVRFRRRRGVRTVARKVNRVSRKVTRLMRNIEPKYSGHGDTNLRAVLNHIPTTTSNWNTNVLMPYRDITQGPADISNRIGDKLTAKYIDLDLSFFLGPTVPSDQIRIVAFILKKNPNQTLTNFDAIAPMYISAGFDNTTILPNFHRKWDDRSSFATILDKTYVIKNIGDYYYGNILANVMSFKRRLRIPRGFQQVQYHNGGVIPSQNELFIWLISSTDVSTSFRGSYRMVYTDL